MDEGRTGVTQRAPLTGVSSDAQLYVLGPREKSYHSGHPLKVDILYELPQALVSITLKCPIFDSIQGLNYVLSQALITVFHVRPGWEFVNHDLIIPATDRD